MMDLVTYDFNSPDKNIRREMKAQGTVARLVSFKNISIRSSDTLFDAEVTNYKIVHNNLC
jgi:hypothetical protein